MHRVLLYSRPGCLLCEEARGAIEAVRRSHVFGFEEVDIDGDDDLVRDFGLRIPVVLVNGVEVFEVSVNEAELVRLLTE